MSSDLQVVYILMNTLERQYGTLFLQEEGTFLIWIRKDGEVMKKIKMFMGAVLCMNLLVVSGCDSVVQSAVVEEKDKTDQKKEENKETVQKTDVYKRQPDNSSSYGCSYRRDFRRIKGISECK